jgi:hypothetical protein
MLQTRLIRPLVAAVAAAAALAACGGDRPIENLERTGATAIEQASALACNGDAETLRKAIEIYTELEGHPPPDEAALVTAQYVREPSKLYDVVNGQIVPVAVDCGGTGAAPATTPSGSPPMTAPSTDLGEIVTSTEAPLTAEQMLAEFTPEEIAEVGGQECAGELASIFVAAQNFVAEQGKDPESLDDLAGYLDQTIDLWVVQDGSSLAAVPGSGCVNLDDSPPDQAASCHTDALTLAVAREAYFAQFGTSTEPTQADLVAAQMLRAPFDDVDLSAGAVVAVAGGPCDGVDLGI